MASRLIDGASSSPPSASSSSLPSYVSDSTVFHSPRSMSPVDDEIRRESTDSPLITDEDHYCASGDHNELSMSLELRGSSSSHELNNVSVWKRIRDAWKKVKPWFFFLLAVTFAGFFASNDKADETGKLFAISSSTPAYFQLNNTKNAAVIAVEVSGPFVDEDGCHGSSVKHNLTMRLMNGNQIVANNQVQDIGINCTCDSAASETHQKPVTVKRRIDLAGMNNETHLMLALTLNTSYPIALSLKHYEERVSEDDQVIFAVVILVGVYILIIFELVHRTTAAMLGSLAALSFLSYIHKRPSLDLILTWIEWDTLSLLFGMMILVAVFAKTGFFDYVALKAYKLSKGHVWWLITLLCACTAFISAVLDNVTVILLLTPVTVTLCQVLNLNPTPILIAEVIFSNIGGTATAIGDPPNVILVSNHELNKKHGINFSDFTVHLIGGIFFCLVVAYVVLRLLYRNVKIVNDDPPIIEEMKREAEIWKRSADRLPVVSAEEKTVKLLLMQKVMKLENRIRNMKRRTSREEAFQQSLQALERKYVIRDKALLMKSLLVIGAVVVLFFVQPFVHSIYLDIGWIAMLGAILLILLADITHFEDLMEQVEWTTLVFFSGLFILMGSLDELGLMDYLGKKTSLLIKDLGTDLSQQGTQDAAVIVIVWVSASASSFIDNIPFTTAMIPVVLEVSKSNKLRLEPLVWALAMGSCLGGNGTLIGASANVVCAGVAEQYGYPITFNNFFKVGFLIMLATTTTATIYLVLLSHYAYN